MATTQNSNINYTGLVQKYIGSAYDNVAAVAGQLDDVDAIAQSIIDGTFQFIADNMDLIKDVMTDINEFNNIYYGIYDEVPVTSPTGDMIDEGDLYYNRPEEQLYIYVGTTVVDECGGVSVENGRWLPVGSVENTTEVIVVTSDMASSGVIQLNYPYIQNQRNLLLFVNSYAQFSTYTHGTLGSYSETTEDTVTFIANKVHAGDPNAHTSIQEGDEILAIIGTNTSTVNHTIQIQTGIYDTEVANEQNIKLPPSTQEPDGMTYSPNENNIEVYVKNNQHSRELKIPTVDYLEIDARTIRFINPLPNYSEVYFKKGKVLSSLPIIPRVIMSDAKPTEFYYNEGQFWYNKDTGRLAILYEDNDLKQWVDISEEHNIITGSSVPVEGPPPVIVNSTIFQKEYPDPSLFAQGTLWLNTSTGELSILYIDDGGSGNAASSQWIKTTTTA